MQEKFDKITPAFKHQINKRFAISEQLQLILTKKGWSQKYLAEQLGKKESEISKWLSGSHNFTSDTLGLIEYHLGEAITICPKDVKTEVRYLFALSPLEAGNTAIHLKNDNVTSKGDLNFNITSDDNISSMESCFTSN
ncbi:MAG: helix-turn-helix transcriptional regulator [Bacteroidetes bacterium]|nr:helix-turn-helix transcriptional regulator [Bacteroidota bacterium]